MAGKARRKKKAGYESPISSQPLSPWGNILLVAAVEARAKKNLAAFGKFSAWASIRAPAPGETVAAQRKTTVR